MTVTNVDIDKDARTLTVTAQFDASIEQVWDLWADPRKLEQWWGPPAYPATVVEHDLTDDGRVTYFMTGSEGDTHHGWWRIVRVDAPSRLAFEDGFGDEDGNPNPEMPISTASVELDERTEGGTQMTLSTTFPSAEAMAQMVEMGMQEGITLAVGQMDALLA